MKSKDYIDDEGIRMLYIHSDDCVNMELGTCNIWLSLDTKSAPGLI